MSASDNGYIQGSYCLNCGAKLHGQYCHHCGQKKLGHEHGFLLTMAHFLGDFFHFDSLIFRTIVPLIFRPGFLTREYLKGRRADYLNPIKMYVFLSLIFFSLLFLHRKESQETSLKVETDLPAVKDSLVKAVPHELSGWVEESMGENEDSFFLQLGNVGFNTLEEYRLWQDSLPTEKRHGKLLRLFLERMLMVNEKTGNSKNFMELLEYNFMHNLPKLAFLLLPLVALWLKFLYFRSKVPYMHHLIVVLQTYNLTFLLASLAIALSFLPLEIESSRYLLMALGLYFVFTLKNFYQQSWKKTILKSLIFSLGLAFMLGLATAINMMYSILTI